MSLRRAALAWLVLEPPGTWVCLHLGLMENWNLSKLLDSGAVPFASTLMTFHLNRPSWLTSPIFLKTDDLPLYALFASYITPSSSHGNFTFIGARTSACPPHLYRGIEWKCCMCPAPQHPVPHLAQVLRIWKQELGYWWGKFPVQVGVPECQW